MAHVHLLDETLRDGQQSLWGMRMQAGMALPVAPLIDRTGFSVIDLTGSSLFEVLIRHCREDPWAGLDELVAAMPRTPKRAGTRSNGAVTFAQRLRVNFGICFGRQFGARIAGTAERPGDIRGRGRCLTSP